MSPLLRMLPCLLALQLSASATAKPTDLQPSLSVMTYNTHLFDIGAAGSRCRPFKQILSGIVTFVCMIENIEPLDFYDTRRAYLIVEAIKLAKSQPHIVALEEVWTEDVSDIFTTELASLYPYSHRPKSNVSALSGKPVGSGLLLLSKYPIVEGSTQYEPYRMLTGQSALTFKGIASATIQMPDSSRIGFFLTHTAGEDDNLCELVERTQQYSEKNPTHAIIAVGDLNVFEDASAKISKCAQTLKIQSPVKLIDAYREKFPNVSEAPGGTCPQSPPARIDYVFYAGNNLLSNVTRFKINDPTFYFYPPMAIKKKPLSDHFPIFAQFGLVSSR